MAKLSKTEIKALAEQISKNIREETNIKIKEENEKLQEDFFETVVGKAVKFLLEDPETKDAIYMERVERLYGRKYGCSLSIDEVERELIIAQISCSDVESLINTVTEKLKTK